MRQLREVQIVAPGAAMDGASSLQVDGDFVVGDAFVPPIQRLPGRLFHNGPLGILAGEGPDVAMLVKNVMEVNTLP